MGVQKDKKVKDTAKLLAKAPKTNRVKKLLAAYEAKQAWKNDMEGLLKRAVTAEKLVRELTEKLEKVSAKVANLEGQLEAKGA